MQKYGLWAKRTTVYWPHIHNPFCVIVKLPKKHLSISQDYSNNARAVSEFTNRGRYEMRHFLANQLQNIYGLSYQGVRDCA